MDSARLWSDIVTGGVTAGILFLGGLLALWRFFLQRQFGNNWSIELDECRVRHTKDGWCYVLTLTIENGSAAAQTIKGWWRQIVFADEVSEEYDPNGHLGVICATAPSYFGGDNQAEDYQLSPGEKYADKMIRWSNDQIHEVCYVEYVLCYRQWRWRILPKWDREAGYVHWTPIPQKETGHISHIMIAPVNRSDLEAANKLTVQEPHSSN